MLGPAPTSPPHTHTHAGAISFWPTIVYAPIEMYLALVRPRPAVAVSLQAINASVALLALGALVGSLYEFAKSAREFRPFAM